MVGAGIWGGAFGALPGFLANEGAKDLVKGVVQGGLRLTGTFFDSQNNE